MEQPPLDHHYLALHLGGAKTIERRGLHASAHTDAKAGSVSIIPAGTNYSWTTKGPIDFAHLYLHPRTLERVIGEEFDRDPRSVELIDSVASRLPLISALMIGMLDQLERPIFGSRIVLETLLHSLVVRMIAECSTLGVSGSLNPHSIAPRRLRHVLEFIESNIAADLSLEDLAAAAGSSRYHFSRAFRNATGLSPYRYLIQRRVDAAKLLLLEQDQLPICEVAQRCGFNSQNQLATMFRRAFGTSPSRFRREH